MPSYTHMRRAMPVLVAHYLLSHAAALRRDHQRLGDRRATKPTRCRSGSGAIAGTGYAVDVDALAARLGFSRVVANSMDAVVGSRLRRELSPRLRAGDGAS